MIASSLGWMATALFAASYLFRQSATLRRIQAGRLSLDRLWRIHRSNACGCREPDRCRGRAALGFRRKVHLERARAGTIEPPNRARQHEAGR